MTTLQIWASTASETFGIIRPTMTPRVLQPVMGRSTLRAPDQPVALGDTKSASGALRGQLEGAGRQAVVCRGQGSAGVWLEQPQVSAAW